ASIEATSHADLANHSAARLALDRAGAALGDRIGSAAVPWFHDHDCARLAAVIGHVLFRVGDRAAGRRLADAAGQLATLGPAARRTLVQCLLDQAEAEVKADSADKALAIVDHVTDLLRHAPCVPSASRVRAVCDLLRLRIADAGALRMLDAQLAKVAA